MNMKLAELMREISRLSASEQKQLAAYLLHLRLEQDAEWRSEMTRRIDDRTPANWLELGDWKAELDRQARD
jgi:hypothetical protein